MGFSEEEGKALVDPRRLALCLGRALDKTPAFGEDVCR